MFTLLTDADVRDALPPADAVALMRSALVDHHRAELHAPARLHAELGPGGLVFTVGRRPGKTYGFRVYGNLPVPTEQVVVVHDDRTGRLAAIVVGGELGDRRTGALGGVAVDLLARSDAATLGLVGTGRQAWTQVWAAAAVRKLTHIRVYGRSEARRRAFAERCDRELGVPAVAATDPRQAVEGADIVVLATTSPTPVIEGGWIAPGTHVTTVGPKTVAAHECPLDLATRADLAATDSLAQLVSYGADPIVAVERVVPLGAIAAGAAAGRRSAADVTLFVSTGLAGTEIVYATAILDAR